MLGRFPLIDGHNDLPWALRERTGQNGGDLSQVVFDLDAPAGGLHTDLPRLAAGRVGAQFWSVYVPASLAGASAAGNGAVAAVLEQIDLARRMIARYPEVARARADRGRRGAGLRLRPGGLAARRRGRPRDRRLARRAADALRARRAVPDPDPQRQRRLGRFGHRRAAGRRADRVRPGRGPRDAADRHAGRPVARVPGHDARRARRGRGAGDLQPLLAPARSATARATCRTTCSPGWRTTAASAW